MKKRGLFLLLSLVALLRSFAMPAGNNHYQIALVVTDSVSGAGSVAYIAFDPSYNDPNYNSQNDDKMTFDSGYILPQIYSFTSDGVPCENNAVGNFNHSYIIPLGISVPGGRAYFLSQSSNSFPAASMIVLEDRLLGIFTDLKIQPGYYVDISQNGRTDGRFFLHLSYPPQITSLAADCYNQNGKININEDTSITWTYCYLYDSALQLMSTDTSVAGNFSFTGLTPGVYTLLFNYNDDVFEEPLFLYGSKIELSISASRIYAAVNETIYFYSEATNAKYYTWNFGDSDSGIIGGIANPQYSYSSPGLYNVTLLCSNDTGCQATGGLTMHIDTNLTAIGNISTDEVQISNINKDVRINISNALQGNYNYEIADLTGKTLLQGPITSGNFIVTTDNFPTGIYVVTVSKPEGSLSKKIFIP